MKSTIGANIECSSEESIGTNISGGGVGLYKPDFWVRSCAENDKALIDLLEKALKDAPVFDCYEKASDWAEEKLKEELQGTEWNYGEHVLSHRTAVGWEAENQPVVRGVEIREGKDLFWEQEARQYECRRGSGRNKCIASRCRSWIWYEMERTINFCDVRGKSHYGNACVGSKCNRWGLCGITREVGFCKIGALKRP